MTLQKSIAEDFLTLAANGQVEIAFEKYISDNFIHHNAYFRGDRNSLLVAMKESHDEFPNKEFVIKKMIEEGDTVAVFSYLQRGEDFEMTVVHMLRFNDAKIVEMWDLGQKFPEEMINENGMF